MMINGLSVRTVLGDVPSSALGIVLPHEHVHCSQLAVFASPSTDRDRTEAYERVTPDNAHKIRQEPLRNLDNIFLDGGNSVEKELLDFARLGGRTLVELTPVGACRNVHEIMRLSRVTGLHLVAGTGYYVEKAHPPEVADHDERWLASQMVKDIEDGIDGTQARAGVIGELGTSNPIAASERKVLAAAVIAQHETGRSIVVHVQPPAWRGHDVLDILFREGGSPNQIALAHINSTIEPGLAYHRELLSRGVTVMYDGFGLVWDFPSLGLKVPSDEQRTEAVVELVRDGFAQQLLLSQDVCTKVHLARFCGPGYSHLVRDILPRLKERGLSDGHLHQLISANPATFLAKESPR